MINKVCPLRDSREAEGLTFNPVLLGFCGNYSDIRLLSHFGPRGTICVWTAPTLILSFGPPRYDMLGEGGKLGVSLTAPSLKSTPK